MDRMISKTIKEFDKAITSHVSNHGNVLHEQKVNLTQIQIMVYLWEHAEEEVCQKDLEGFLRLKKASITGALEAMEKKNLISRRTSVHDGRKKIVEISRAVRSNIRDMIKEYRTIDEKMLKGISEEELGLFFSVIERMKENLRRTETV